MQAVIFIGIQASGKSSFFKENFYHTHLRINLDMLRTRHREQIIFNACLEAKQPFVIDNTNPTIESRQKYIQPAKQFGFEIIGYYFASDLQKAIERNNLREGKAKISEQGIITTYNKLQIPTYAEGFDKLHYVKIIENQGFVIENWKDEI